MSSRKKIALIVLGVVASLLIAVLGTVLFLAPSAARKMVEERLAGVEERTGLDVKFESLDIAGIGEIEIRGLTVTGDEQEFVKIAKISARVDPMAILFGERRTRGVEVSDIDVLIQVDQDGGIPILERLRAKKPAEDETEAKPAKSLRSRIEAVPDALFRNIHVRFEVAEGGPTLPIAGLDVSEASWKWDGESLVTQGSLSTLAGPSPQMHVPKSMEVQMTFDENLRPTSGDLKADGIFSITGLDPLPFLTFQIEGIGIADDGAAALTNLRVTNDKTPVVEIKEIRFELGSLTDLRNLKFSSMTLDSPTLLVSFDQSGTSVLNDIQSIILPRVANRVVSRARGIADNVVLAKQTNPPVDDEDAEPAEEPVSAPNEPATESRLKRLLLRLPDQINIANATIKISDQRPTEVERPAKNLMMRNGTFSVAVDKESGEIAVAGGFDATAEGAPRGSSKIDLKIQPLTKAISGTVDVEALDLSWVGQILSPVMGSLVRGGTVRAKVDFESRGPAAFDVKGLVSVSDLTFFDARLAEEPITGVTASYSFDAIYDAALKMPAAKLLKVPVYKDVVPPALPPATPIGGLVFQKGMAELGGVKMSFRPAFYGLNAPGRLPARMDVAIDLPKTPVMALLNAIPAALMGATAGTKMEGFFEWKFDVEVPLYRAGDMEWKADPKLSEFTVLSIPDEVDVRKLMDAMPVVIVDSIEEENDFTRTIQIRAASAIPAQWMLENTGLTLEQIDTRRRRRGWPSLPPYGVVRDDFVDSGQVWETQWAQNQQAKKPWQDDAQIQRTPDQPWGPYVFTPIQYISPYMVRAVITTEDNSFFTHDGFNTLALKESIERNLSAGEFKRGASTIAMQMIKNVFLNRKKVMSRKLQEAFLVFMMESAIDMPKARIMEVYLNVIEFGPEIFGIHEAAVHYFGKRPDKLTLGEVAWLVSIIPGPKRYHTYWERGQITPQYFIRMKRYIQAMFNRGRITEEELNEAMLEIPEFYKPGPDDPVLRPPSEPVIPLFDEFLAPPPMLLAPVDP